jgi:hypothetical protein
MTKLLITLVVLGLPFTAVGTTWIVPQDAPTIQGALELVAPGDTVIIGGGTYSESALDLTVPILLRSEADEPDGVVIDGGALDTILYCAWSEGTATVRGITFTSGHGALCGGARLADAAAVEFERCVFADNAGGVQPGGGRGGAVGCFDQSRARLHECRLVCNGAYGGGGVYGEGSTAVILEDCLLVENASVWGGGVELRDDCAGTIAGCTFYANESHSWQGAGITNWSSHPVQMTATIIAFSTMGSALEGAGELAACDLHANAHGDWTSQIADQYGVGCNMALDPLFCDATGGDFTLHVDSPCRAANNDCDVPIGAFGMGCPLSDAPSARPPQLVAVECYPNPFNPLVTVVFTLAHDANLLIAVFDLAGRRIAELADRRFAAGEHRLQWDGRDRTGGPSPSGVYLVRLQRGSDVITRRVALVR